MVIWGNRNDENTSPEVCHRINAYIQSTLGPYITETRKAVSTYTSLILASSRGGSGAGLLGWGTIIQNWTFGGHKFLSCVKFLITIVYYRKHCRLGGHGPRPSLIHPWPQATSIEKKDLNTAIESLHLHMGLFPNTR